MESNNIIPNKEHLNIDKSHNSIGVDDHNSSTMAENTSDEVVSNITDNTAEELKSVEVQTEEKRIKIKESNIRQEVAGHRENQAATFQSIKDVVLLKILESLSRISFRKEVFKYYPSIDRENFKLARKHYLVITIEKILEVARKYSVGLCRQNYDFYSFDGTYWSVIDQQELKIFLGLAAKKLGIYKYEAKHFGFRDALFRQFETEVSLPNPKPDKKKTLINLSNGTFEFSSNSKFLRDYDIDDFLKYKLPFEYKEDAVAPLFHKYLIRVLPDPCARDVLGEYIASVFVKSFKLEKALVLFGSGANGKSVFFEIITALLGSTNVSNFSLQSLTNENGYYRAKLANTLVNYASEINSKLDSSFFKQLVSGEPVEARLPHGHPFTLYSYGKLIFNCNVLPKEVEHSNAYFRRFLIIPFSVTIPESEQDKQLADKIIQSELSGVFNWVLRGVERLLQQKKFSPCDSVEREVDKYRKDSDSVHSFIDEEGYQPSKDNTISLKELYSRYVDFCMEDGYHRLSKKNFNKRLFSLGFSDKRRKNGIVIFAEQNDSESSTLSSFPTPVT